MKIIVGLGNPGEKYLKTRHNAGELYLSKLRNAWSADDFTETKNALWLETNPPDGGSKDRVYLIFPTEMMNNSGESLKKTFAALKIKPRPEDILVLHDDLDIEFGRIKMSFGRSSAGHKGVASIIKLLKTNKFWRLRVGIGVKKKPLSRAKSREDHKKTVDFILKKFTPAEERTLNKNFKKILAALEMWLKKPDKAVSIINSK